MSETLQLDGVRAVLSVIDGDSHLTIHVSEPREEYGEHDVDAVSIGVPDAQAEDALPFFERHGERTD